MIRLQSAIEYLERFQGPGQPNRADLEVITANRLKFAQLLKKVGCSLDTHSNEEIMAAINEKGLENEAEACGGQRLLLSSAALAWMDKRGKRFFRKSAATLKKTYQLGNDTRNMALPSGQIRAVHALLITKFNRETVTL